MTTQIPTARPIHLTHYELAVESRTFWGDAWYRLSRNRVAVVSMFFVIGLVVLALSADGLRAIGLIEGINDQHRGSSLSLPMTCATMQPNQQPYPPGAAQFCFVFGSDALGRDVLSRTVYGTRVSLAVALVGAILSLGIGIVYGAISGYYGGRVDNLMMRLLDFLYGAPSLVLIILFQTFLNP